MADISIKGHSPILRQGYKKGGSGYHTTKEGKKARKGLDNVTKQLLNAGNKSYKRGDLGKATSYYEKALEFDPEFYLAYFQLGVLQKKQGQSKAAIESLNRVIEIRPDHDKTWFTLGTAYETDGNVDMAIDHYKKAIDINPGYSKAYGNLGKLYTDKQEFKEAEDVLKKHNQQETVVRFYKTINRGDRRVSIGKIKKFAKIGDLIGLTTLSSAESNYPSQILLINITKGAENE